MNHPIVQRALLLKRLKKNPTPEKMVSTFKDACKAS